MANLAQIERKKHLREYCVTRDPKLRDQVIREYMSSAETVIRNLGETGIEQDDLLQIAYEALINSIDEIKDPGYFNQLLRSKIIVAINTYRKDYSFVDHSLSEVEVVSNSNLEERIINDQQTKEMIDKFYETLNSYNGKRAIEVFKQYYGIGCEPMNSMELAKKYKISHQAVNGLISNLLVYIFLRMQEFGYSPSKKIKILADHSHSLRIRVMDSFLIYCVVRTNKFEGELTFYRDFDTPRDTHTYTLK